MPSATAPPRNSSSALLAQPAVRIEHAIADSAETVVRHHQQRRSVRQQLLQLAELTIELLIHAQDAVFHAGGWVVNSGDWRSQYFQK